MNFILNHTKISIKDIKTNKDTVVLDTKNQVVGKCVAGIPFVDVVDDSLDSFVFTLKDYPRRKAFAPFSFVTFTVDDGIKPEETTLFVLFDHVKSYSLMRNTYEHSVTCVEATKILEKTKIYNLVLTNPNNSLSEQITKALTNAEPIFYSNTETAKSSRFFIGESLNAFLSGKAGRDFYFGNTDLRTVLDAMLQPYNARIYVESVSFSDSGNITNITLGYCPLNIVADVTPEWFAYSQGEIIGEEMENNGQDYAGKIVARGYNSIPQEPMTFTDTFKSENYKISDTNACVMLPFPISDKGFEHFYVYAPVVYVYTEVDENRVPISETITEKIDIASRLIPQEEYDLLPEEDENEEDSRHYIPFIKGSLTISVGQTYSNFWGTTRLTMKTILDKERPERQTAGEYNYEVYSSAIADGNNYQNFKFECTYYPQLDSVVEITKPGVYDKDEILMGIMDSQTEQTLDIERHGNKLAGLIKRTGNTECCLDVKAIYFSKLLPLMSRIDLPDAEDEEEKNYVLYKREYSIFDNFINCRYYFSQNYNAIQANAGVNRERHIFDIPLESDEAPLVIKQYLRFSFNEPPNIVSLFNHSLITSALSTLTGTNLYRERRLRHLLFQSTGAETVYPSDSEWFMCPLVSYGQDKCMTFMTRTLDNYSVSYSRDGYTFSIWGDGGHKITYNRYVDIGAATIGECGAFNLSFAYSFKGEDSQIMEFPIAYTADFESAMWRDNTSITFKYNKDRAQRPLFVLSLECIPAKEDYGNIIIGTSFVKNNNLVKDNGKEGLQGLSLYLNDNENWVFNGDEENVFAFSLKIPVSDCFKLLTPYSYTAKLAYKGDKPSGIDEIKSWAIADENKNIYLAVNGGLRDIYAQVVGLEALDD